MCSMPIRPTEIESATSNTCTNLEYIVLNYFSADLSGSQINLWAATSSSERDLVQ